ncbi:MAG: CHRD domain-containing protein [Caulobacteraceae bacterium]
MAPSCAGVAETPPNPASAKGEVVGVLDTDRRTFEYTVTYKGLSGPIVAAGFKKPTSPPDDPIVTAPDRRADDPRRGAADVGADQRPQRQPLDLRHLDQRQPRRRNPRKVERSSD